LIIGSCLFSPELKGYSLNKEFNGASAMELVSQSKVVVAEARGQFGNPEEGKRLPLEALKLLPSNDYSRRDLGQ
jgi:hypothetical protein